MSHKPLLLRLCVASAGFAASLAFSGSSLACGGFFCSVSQPVNQAAERIVFADNGDGTVTAVIQILYQGPSDEFSWLLPIPSVPEGDEIAVASNLAFQRLQAASNPRYSLNTRVEGTCRDRLRGVNFASGASGGGQDDAESAPGKGGGVTVEASGIVGAFDWQVISLDASLPDAADVAVEWLTQHGYDVPDGAKGLLRPYLQDGLYLLALRLTKGADTGSIRPISLTYDAAKPMIPIKLTAVAANQDMGVMTWLLGKSRAVPQNYLSLELNEARIDWLTSASNYDSVVTAAADDAGGQGFVTEQAGPTTLLAETVWGANDAAQWDVFQQSIFSSHSDLFATAVARYGTWDGFWDATRTSITLPDGVQLSDLRQCPTCYADQLQYSPSEFLSALEKDVIQPVRGVQELLDKHPYVTRLYTTMSASEMTIDPAFTFNPDLPEVDNLHTAERIIECSPGVETFEAPYRIVLPQGGVVRGVGASSTWPSSVADQPANLRILRLSESGRGDVLEDNTQVISQALASHNQSIPGPAMASGGCAVPSGKRAATGATAPWVIASFLSLLGLTRRRRR